MSRRQPEPCREISDEDSLRLLFLLISLVLCPLYLQAVQSDDKPNDDTLGPSRPKVRSSSLVART